MPATPTQLKKFRRKLKVRAFDAIGRECVFCAATDDLEAAHVLPTKIHGEGRGTDRRYLDVIRNPSCYRPMCKKCHRMFDKLTHGLMTAARGAKEEPIPF